MIPSIGSFQDLNLGTGIGTGIGSVLAQPIFVKLVSVRYRQAGTTPPQAVQNWYRQAQSLAIWLLM